MLQIHDLCKTFGPGVTALDDVNLTVEAGEDLVILGPSGSGKSTLLRLLAGLETATTGSVLLHGQELLYRSPADRSIAMLPQRPAFYPQLTAEANLKAAGPNWPNQAIDALKIGHLLKRYPHELSGGERQRLALARLLTRPADLWLLDEPFNGLDFALRQEFRLDLLLLKAISGATMLIVTHDLADARALGRQIGVLGQGKLWQLGSLGELQTQPQHLSVWQSLALGSLIPGHAAGGEQAEFRSACGAVVARLPDWLRNRTNRPSHLTLGIRPLETLVDSPATALPAGSWQRGWPLILVEPVGRGWLLTLARGSTRVTVWQATHAPPPVGHYVDWFFPTNAVQWYDTQSGLLLRSPE